MKFKDVNINDLIEGVVDNFKIKVKSKGGSIKADLKAEECVFIDDKAENVEGAKAVGYQGIVFKDYEEVKVKLEEMLGGR